MKPETIELSDSMPTGTTLPSTPRATTEIDENFEILNLENHHATENNEDRVTDHGRRAWFAVIAGFINFWAGFGILNSWGTFQAKYPNEPWAKDTSLSDINWIGSVQPGILFCLGSLAGISSDKISAGILIQIGTGLFLASYLILAEFGNSFVDFLGLQGFMFGISNTLLYYPVTSVVSDWFDQRRGLALGLISSGSSLGGIFWPIVIDNLHEVFGMKRALQGVGLIPLVPLLISSFLVRERDCNHKITFRRIVGGNISDNSNHSDNRGSVGVMNGLKTIMQVRFLCLSFALFFIYGGMLLPFNYIPQFAEYNGKRSMGNNLLAICYSGSVVGRIGTGALADHFGTFNILCMMAILTGTLTLCWILMRTYAAMIAFAVLYGLFSGGLIPLGSACVAKITPREEMQHIGFRLGFMMMVCSVSAFGGGPLSGYLLESQGNETQG